MLNSTYIRFRLIQTRTCLFMSKICLPFAVYCWKSGCWKQNIKILSLLYPFFETDTFFGSLYVSPIRTHWCLQQHQHRFCEFFFIFHSLQLLENINLRVFSARCKSQVIFANFGIYCEYPSAIWVRHSIPGYKLNWK